MGLLKNLRNFSKLQYISNFNSLGKEPIERNLLLITAKFASFDQTKSAYFLETPGKAKTFVFLDFKTLPCFYCQNDLR